MQVQMGDAGLAQAIRKNTMGNFGAIAFAAEMAKVKMAKAGGHDFGGSIRGSFV
jgi:hypothetical protein